MRQDAVLDTHIPPELSATTRAPTVSCLLLPSSLFPVEQLQVPQFFFLFTPKLLLLYLIPKPGKYTSTSWSSPCSSLRGMLKQISTLQPC